MTSQVLINGILAGLMWGLVGLGFSMVYSAARFLHAAYAATFLAGAYIGVSLSRLTVTPLALCACGAIAAAMILGLLIEILVYRPLRRSGSSSLVLFLASLGIVIVIENCVAWIFGSEVQLPGGRGTPVVLRAFGAQITGVQFGSAIATLVVFVVTWGFTRLTLMGKQLRAVASNPELAAAFGIDETTTLSIAMLIGSALSGVSGFLLAYDTSATPTMGFTVLLIGVTATIIGGIGRLPGAMLGGLLVGITQHVGGWFFSSEWQEGMVYLILFIFLLLRPQGLFGKTVRKAMV